MDKFLSLFPKNVLAFLLIAGGILFIVLSQPPHSVCDSQMAVVDKNQARFLFRDPKMKKVNPAEVKKAIELCHESKDPDSCYDIYLTRYERLTEFCKATNTPGGCYELFTELKRLVRDLATLSSECSTAIGGTSEYKTALMGSVELMVRLGWGENPPSSYSAKLGWLEASDLSLFCRLHERITALYGESTWESFREKMMLALPGAKDLARNQVWDLSLFSENCARYP